MGADFSRIRSNPLLDFAAVELKQGAVVLDADFNELVAVLDRRLRATASDVLGRSTVSSTTPDAFKVSIVSGALVIAKGRLYVDGLLAENHGAASTDPSKKIFDPLLAESQFADPIPYGGQPYLPSPPTLPKAGRHLVYLDVWDREVTHLERPDLIEVAVGVEASSRMQTAWQVRVLNADAGNASCNTADDDLDDWSSVISPSTGRLTTGTFEVPPEEDPCELPPTGGYRGLENQTYRVEIHDPGQPGASATFKWSRENASVGSRVVSMISGSELELQTLGKDDVLRFNTGDWVEVLDDVRELSQHSGEMRQITVNEAARRITFTPPLPPSMLPGSFPSADFPNNRNLRVRRWDHKHKVFSAGAGGTTSVFQDLDAGTTGVINAPAARTTIILENGITVSFASTGTKGFRAGDYWVFAARTADASVETLSAAPPRGIHHHYARLGIWDVGSGAISDCRHPWPPEAGMHDCGCSACVTPASHASGQLTIQDAVNNTLETGGTVCIGAGRYQLTEPVRVTGGRSIRIKGQGPATVIVTSGGAFAVTNCLAVAIEDLAILSVGQDAAVNLRTVLGLSLQRLLILVLRGNDATSAAIALSGAILGATIRDNAIMAPFGIRVATTGQATGTAPLPGLLVTAAMAIEDNVFWCERSAVVLAGRVFHLLTTRISGNQVNSSQQGALTALGLCGPGASMRVVDNNVGVASGPGITAGVDGLWIADNKLSSAAKPDARQSADAGILLRVGLDPSGADQCQILSNQIAGFSGAAIAIQSPTRDLIVKLNIIERCGNGIISDDEANGASISIENNHLADIGAASDAQTGAVVAIGVTKAAAATVTGNTIRRVGQQQVRATLNAGIAATSVQRLVASGNDVSDIAPSGDYIGLGAGIMLRAPFAQASIVNNQVARESVVSAQATRSQWYALLVDHVGARLVSRLGTYAAVKIDDARTLVFGGKRPYLVTAPGLTDATGAAAVRGASASVLGNVVAARGTTPAVDVTASGDCLFNDNRCELRGGASAVRLSASAAIVNANRVVGGEISIELLGNIKRMTVVGNVTSGPIIAGGALPPPWEALNVRA